MPDAIVEIVCPIDEVVDPSASTTRDPGVVELELLFAGTSLAKISMCSDLLTASVSDVVSEVPISVTCDAAVECGSIVESIVVSLASDVVPISTLIGTAVVETTFSFVSAFPLGPCSEI